MLYLLLSMLIILLGGCSLSNSPEKERDFEVADLFLPLEVFPSNWQEVGSIKAMGPDSPIGIGDPDDAYLSYKTRQSPRVGTYFVYRNSTAGAAERLFDRELSLWFDNDRITILEPWHTPNELSYQSAYADQFHTACAILEMLERNTMCRVHMQYQEFVVEFNVVISNDTLSLEQFNQVICNIDTLFIMRMDLSAELIICP